MSVIYEYLIFELPVAMLGPIRADRAYSDKPELILVGHLGKMYSCKLNILSCPKGNNLEILLTNAEGELEIELHTKDPQAEIRERVWEVLPMKLVEYYK